ncbi:hypothetical protein ABC255_09470 [Neobacillus sp. 3P2-tot-E-2]|uniref:hypothetical protein n=1 Tax=Neobacillus sp. 3P2-tot-E-2 TaxID=3132212 RepID=UPI00399F7022
MNVELLKTFAEVSEAFRAERDVLSIGIGSAHVRLGLLEKIGNADNIQISNRSDSEYPFELSIVIEGLKLYALAKTKDLGKFPQLKVTHKEQLKEMLMKQLAELENDEEVTA